MKSTTSSFIHPEISEWLLMKSSYSPYVVSVMYILTLTCIRKFILSRSDPNEYIRTSNKILNFFIYVMAITNWSLFIFFIYMTVQLDYSWICEPPSKSIKAKGVLVAFQSLFGETPHEEIKRMELRMAGGVWWYVISKCLDFVDHGVLVLRNDPVSFFQAWHHILMVILPWLSLKYAPGGSTVIWIIFNCGYLALTYTLHIVRHLYLEKSEEGLRFWRNSIKPWILRGQDLQYFITGFHCITSLFKNCGYPRLYSAGLLTFVLVLTALSRRS